jgi:uncharacterized surface protein with fasciclin (FAS1) repeats
MLFVKLHYFRRNVVNSTDFSNESGKSAYFTASDLKGTNGVVHVIDGVLLPK